MRFQRILFYVDAVARHGSIRKAADELNITPSALNRRIQDIEEELRSPLFERWPKGVRLTTAGEMFLHSARSQIADAIQLQSMIDDLRGLRRGNVKIACSQAIAADYLPDAIIRFRKRHPLVMFEVKVIDHGLALTALENFEADLAIVYRPAAHPGILQVASFRQRVMAVMRRGHPLESAEKLRLSDLNDYPLALPDRRYGVRQMIEEFSMKRKLTFNIVLQSDSFDMLKGIVSRSDAVTLQIEVGSWPNSRNIVSRPIDHRDAPADIVGLCQISGRSLPVAAALFAEQIASDFKNGRKFVNDTEMGD